eukprot:m.1284475 g.1284475  ORF g.1284475 m.1284475 type:complete len:54 (-) comp24778_c0_seq35:148-309(-)
MLSATIVVAIYHEEAVEGELQRNSTPLTPRKSDWMALMVFLSHCEEERSKACF